MKGARKGTMEFDGQLSK